MSTLVTIYEVTRTIVYYVLLLYAIRVFIIADDRTERLTALSVMILIPLYLGLL